MHQIHTTMKISENIISAAIACSTRSNMKFKLGAIVYKNETILGRGYNHYLRKTSKFGHPVYSLHAESHAIQFAIKKHGRRALVGASIYIYRRNGNLARPCPCCLSLIEMVGITEINYSR